MNDFEQKIEKAHYNSYNNWNELRAVIKSIVREFVQKPECEGAVYRDDPDVNKTTMQILFFRIYGCAYIWFEGLDSETRKLNVAQLEKCENDYLGKVLYSCEGEDATVITPLIIKSIKEGLLKQIG